jgi:RNA polymerase sigma factor (sigma-70 family)
VNVVPTVFIVDDDASVLKSLERLVRSAGYQTRAYDSPRRFLADEPEASPGCLILDMDMPEVNGLELQHTMAARQPVPPIIFLTGHGDIPMSVRALKAGAVDFLTKPWREDQLFAAIEQALARDLEAWQARAQRAGLESRLASLTPREREVLALVAAGRLNKQIAADLGICEQTIKVHRGRVMEKLRAKTLADLVRMADNAGISPSTTGAP